MNISSLPTDKPLQASHMNEPLQAANGLALAGFTCMSLCRLQMDEPSQASHE